LPRSDPRSLFGVRAIFWCSQDHPVPDGDNCMKLVLDALQHAIWENDRQVREQASHIAFSPRNPRTDLVIWRLTADWIE